MILIKLKRSSIKLENCWQRIRGFFSQKKKTKIEEQTQTQSILPVGYEGKNYDQVSPQKWIYKKKINRIITRRKSLQKKNLLCKHVLHF